VHSRKAENEQSKEISNDNNNIKLPASRLINNINNKNIQTATINKEELLKFVYDISFQNLTASSFKYAMRNLKHDQKEKEEYILVIHANYSIISNVFLKIFSMSSEKF